MRTSIETDRLLIRELVPSDDKGMFELDSDPAVHRYLGNKSVTDISQSREMIAQIMQQYKVNGIGRWAVILKETNQFIGWSGLKLESNINGHKQFYDIGYRLIQQHWGKGYAYESAQAFMEFGFNELKLKTICAYADADHFRSRNVLEKIGLRYVNSFELEGTLEVWYELQNPAIY